MGQSAQAIAVLSVMPWIQMDSEQWLLQSNTHAAIYYHVSTHTAMNTMNDNVTRMQYLQR